MKWNNIEMKNCKLWRRAADLLYTMIFIKQCYQSQLWADTLTSDCHLNTGYHLFCSQTNNYLSQVTRFTIFTVNVERRAAAPTTAVIRLVYRTAVPVLRLSYRSFSYSQPANTLNPLNPELNPICCLLTLLGAHHFLHVSRIRVKLLTFRRLMSYIYIWSTHSWYF